MAWWSLPDHHGDDLGLVVCSDSPNCRGVQGRMVRDTEDGYFWSQLLVWLGGQMM